MALVGEKENTRTRVANEAFSQTRNIWDQVVRKQGRRLLVIGAEFGGRPPPQYLRLCHRYGANQHAFKYEAVNCELLRHGRRYGFTDWITADVTALCLE